MTLPPVQPLAPQAPLPSLAKPMFSPRDSHMIKSYLLGGAALGGGAGMVTSLLNYLGTVKEEGDDAAKPTDDDTLYLNLRRRPGQKQASMAGSLSLAGGTVSALGAYALVHSLYQKKKKQEIQDRLTAAQQGYIDTLGAGTDANKMASLNPAPTPDVPGKTMGMTEGLFSLPGTAALLLGTAAAGVTNAMLNKTFPVAKSPARRDPRRVVVRQVDDPLTKQADEHDGEELVIRLLMATKSARLHEFQDLVHAIADGRRDEIAHGLLNYGVDTAADMVKGASHRNLSDTELSLACGIATRDPLIGPSLGVLAAAEFHDHFPSVVKIASALPQEHQDALSKIACILGATMRAEACEELANSFGIDKSAEGMGMTSLVGADLLNDLLISGMVKKDNPAEGEVEQNVMSSNSQATTKVHPRVMADDRMAAEFQNKNKDMIDAALAPN